MSDIARVFDALGWFSPAIIKVKILLQRFWEHKIDWDGPSPPDIKVVWYRWRSVNSLAFWKGQSHVVTSPRILYLFRNNYMGFQMHPAVVYLRMVDTRRYTHLSCYLKDTSLSNQTSKHTSFGVMWCIITCSTTSLYQGSPRHVCNRCRRLD